MGARGKVGDQTAAAERGEREEMECRMQMERFSLFFFNVCMCVCVM